MAKADLHLHSTCSDGRFDPATVVRKAKERGLSVIALTDHDTISGVEEAIETGKRLGVQVVSGVEITALFNGRERHFLAYSFPSTSSELASFLESQRKNRVTRAHEMIEKLEEVGISISKEEVHEIAGNGTVARPHLAEAIKRKGYISHTRQAYKYIGNGGPAYVQASLPPLSEVVRLVHSLKGVVCVAHPGNSYTTVELGQLIEIGVDGFEMIHPVHPYALQVKFENLANSYDLIKTGGSDFHGFRLGDEYLLGTVTINTTIIQPLIDRFISNQS